MQIADDLFNSGNIPVAGIPRLPGLVRSLEEFTKTADVLRPYLEKAFADKGIVMLARLHLSAAGGVGKARSSPRSTTSRA